MVNSLIISGLQMKKQTGIGIMSPYLPSRPLLTQAGDAYDNENGVGRVAKGHTRPPNGSRVVVGRKHVSCFRRFCPVYLFRGTGLTVCRVRSGSFAIESSGGIYGLLGTSASRR